MTFCKRTTVLFILSLCWAGLCLNAQPAQLNFRQYNTDDGLPSSETYTILEDRSGYLWIGTDNGVARFDGYEFEVFDTDDGLEDMVVFGIVEDEKGRIWISTYSGKTYFFDHGRFYPFAHNDIIVQIKQSKHLGVLIDVTPDEDLILSFKNAGVLKVSSSGTTEWLVRAESGGIYLYESIKAGRLTSLPKPHGFFHSLDLAGNDSTDIFILNEKGARPIVQLSTYAEGRARSYFSAVFSTPGGWECVVSNSYEVFILNGDGTRKHFYSVPRSRYNYFMPGFYPDTYWALLERGKGLEGHDFRQGGEAPIVSPQLFGHSLTSGLFDESGGFWITTLDAGIFYCSYPKQLVYRKNDVSQNGKAISIALTGPGDFYAGYDDGTIFHYGNNSTELRPIQESTLVAPERLFDMHYDSIHSYLLTPFYSFVHPVPEGTKLTAATIEEYIDESGKNLTFKYFNQLSGKESRKIYGSHGSHLATIDLDDRRVEKLNSGGRALSGSVHVFGLHPDGTKIVGTLSGVMELKEDGSMVPNNLGIEELSERVVFIKDLGHDDLLIGTRGNGLVYLGPDTIYLIRESDGLASNMIRDIHLSNTGIIWISTLNGLSRLSLSAGGEEYQVRTFRTEHGLPSNEVYQADTYGDEVWLATSAGVVRFEEPPVVTVSSRPVIRSVILNGDELPDTTTYQFSPGPQNVSISFGTINFVLGNELLYRYRLNETPLWQHSKERTVNYPNLGSGSYRFEVQSRNQDGIWSESTVREISVATPWYTTVWAIIGGILLIAAVLSGFFLLRERRKRREQDLLFQITQLEHAALHAQMNPHFVFNALNSIQNFVLENNAKQAATYLSRFARVIRQTLRSSVDGRHRLSEELMMLETYLSLEKLRFKEGFSYTLETDPSLPKEDIDLPPLLIQPFVENAIIHGLKDRKQGGRITVRFTGTADNLTVVIEDNGIGFDPNQSNMPDSLGMNITRKRLDMMKRGQEETSGMEIHPLFTEDGTPRGTRVTLFIRPLTPLAPAPAP